MPMDSSPHHDGAAVTVAPVGQDLPEPGTMKEVAHGLFWLRMPLPFALDHINLWALREADGWTLVDTGIGFDETQKLWHRLWEGPMPGKKERLIITHHHPDHFGLAGWLQDQLGCQVEMTRAEWEHGRWLYDMSDPDYSAAFRAFYERLALPEEEIKVLTGRGNQFRKRFFSRPETTVELPLGAEIRFGGRDWTTVWGRGHVEGHACLHDRDNHVFIAGDQLLQKISPNVSVFPWAAEADPLSDFIETQARLRHLPDETLVLPSHGRPFYGAGRRAAELVAHHDERLARLEEGCRPEPKRIMQILPMLFERELNGHQLFFAVGEAVAHANHLVAKGRLERIEEDGQLSFKTH